MRKRGWTWLGTLLAIVCGVAFGLFAGIAVVRAQTAAAAERLEVMQSTPTQPASPSPQESAYGASEPAQ